MKFNGGFQQFCFKIQKHRRVVGRYIQWSWAPLGILLYDDVYDEITYFLDIIIPTINYLGMKIAHCDSMEL